MIDKDYDYENELGPVDNLKRSYPRKTGRAYRRSMKKKKKDRLMKIIINATEYNPAVGYVDCEKIDGKWKPVGRYIKYPKNSKAQRYLKKQSNKKARKTALPPKGNEYRKHFEYWWTLY